MALIPYLTTVDNPFNPATHFREWYTYDMLHGYNTCGFMARLYSGGPMQSPEDNRLAREAAIDEIAHYNVSGVHKKIFIDEDTDEIVEGYANIAL